VERGYKAELQQTTFKFSVSPDVTIPKFTLQCQKVAARYGVTVCECDHDPVSDTATVRFDGMRTSLQEVSRT
jgi:hypothetical protein